jgi:hypothetical protein
VSLHIYTTHCQPATRYEDHNIDPPHTFTHPGNSLVWCHCCEKRRPAKNAVVQVYYDGMYFWCAPGKGCKHPDVIAAKARREFRSRSAGQKRRWAKVTEGA